MSEIEIVPGIFILNDRKCPKCGAPLFRKPCPCPFKRQGWTVCARCTNTKCATVIGIEKRKVRGDRARGQKRRNKGALGPFGISN